MKNKIIAFLLGFSIALMGVVAYLGRDMTDEVYNVRIKKQKIKNSPESKQDISVTVRKQDKKKRRKKFLGKIFGRREKTLSL